LFDFHSIAKIRVNNEIPKVKRFHLVTALSVACILSNSFFSIRPCCAITALSTFRNSLHSARFSRASAPLIKYKLLAETVELSVHCDKATRGAASSIAMQSQIYSIEFFIYNSLGIVQGYILKPYLSERVVQ
jgi:hypothetical protein